MISFLALNPLWNYGSSFLQCFNCKREDPVEHVFLPLWLAYSFVLPPPLLLLHISNQTINLYPSSFPNSCLYQSLFSVTAISAPFCLHFPTSHILSGGVHRSIFTWLTLAKCKNSDISLVLWWQTLSPYSLFKWPVLFHVINHVDDESRVPFKHQWDITSWI